MMVLDDELFNVDYYFLEQTSFTKPYSGKNGFCVYERTEMAVSFSAI